MKWKEVKDQWPVLGKRFQTKWTKLTDADLKAIGGKREELIERLHKTYKLEKPKLEKEIDEFTKTLKVKL